MLRTQSNIGKESNRRRVLCDYSKNPYCSNAECNETMHVRPSSPAQYPSPRLRDARVHPRASCIRVLWSGC